MSKLKRNAFDKLNTLLFGKDIRITDGEPYTEVRAFDFSSYYPEENYITEMEVPTENVFDIKTFGAVPNDDEMDNSLPINMAIDAASKANGTVLVSGGDFTTTTIFLKSNVTLFIEKNSSLSANKSGVGYKNKSIIFGENLDNITITGGGKIKGNGEYFGRKPFLDNNVFEPDEYIDVIEMRQTYRKQLRFAHSSKYGGPITLRNCQNINANNFIIENSAYWTFKIENCNNVKIFDAMINNNRNVANADGFDVCGSSNIMIDHCFVSTADDGIVIKNAIWLGTEKPMENITVRECEIISRTNGVKIGTETTNDISGVNIEDCRIFMTDLYPGTVSAIAVESADGSKISGVNIKNIETDRCSCPLFIRLGNRNRAATVSAENSNAIEFGEKKKFTPAAEKSRFDKKGEIDGVHVDNLRSTDVEIPIIICGFKEKGITKYVKNISLSNVALTYSNRPETIDKRLFIPEYTKEYPEANRFRNLPSYALFSRHTENLKMDNFKCIHEYPTWKKEIIEIDNK